MSAHISLAVPKGLADLPYPCVVSLGKLPWTVWCDGYAFVALKGAATSERPQPKTETSIAGMIRDAFAPSPSRCRIDMRPLSAFANKVVADNTRACDECRGDGFVYRDCDHCDESHRCPCGCDGGKFVKPTTMRLSAFRENILNTELVSRVSSGIVTSGSTTKAFVRIAERDVEPRLRPVVFAAADESWAAGIMPMRHDTEAKHATFRTEART